MLRARALARVSFASLASVACLALVTGCGDDGGDDSPEAQAFCNVVDPIQQLPTVLENYEDVAGVEATMTAAEDALAQVSGTPPEGIAEDVQVVNSIFGPANEALKAVGYDYNQLDDAEAATVAALTEPDFQRAADNIQTWSADNCD